MHRNQWRAALLTVLAATALLNACKKERDDSARGATEDSASAAPHVKATAGTYTVTFHMTGQLLVVPPPSGNGVTRVVIPTSPSMKHVAWLGFGIPQSASWVQTLCDTTEYGPQKIRYGKIARDSGGICYVNLREWRMDPIGQGGTKVSAAELEAKGLLNVTRGSGTQPSNRHHVETGNLKPDSVVVFNAGTPGTPCPLGRWTYQPAGAGVETPDLANVLPWVISFSRGTAFGLVFTHRTTGTRIPVAPKAYANDDIEMLLVNVLEDELRDLPPGKPTPPTSPPDAAKVHAHFNVYYDLLHNPTPVPASSRSFPTFLRNKNQVCSVQISRFTKGIVEPPAIGTYACLPATGEGV